MTNYMNPILVFPVLIVLYIISFMMGVITGGRYEEGFKYFHKESGEEFIPLLQGLMQKLNKSKKRARQKGGRVYLLGIIFLEKFIIKAVIIRIIYGVIFIIPLFLTLWSGFKEGIMYKTKDNKLISFLYGFSYLFAGTAGVNLGTAIVIYLFSDEKFFWDIPWRFILLSAVICLTAALLEIRRTSFKDKK
ncbi:MAG: hypothetical protein ACOC21_01460 [Halanaerobiales bacterium]